MLLQGQDLPAPNLVAVVPLPDVQQLPKTPPSPPSIPHLFPELEDMTGQARVRKRNPPTVYATVLGPLTTVASSATSVTVSAAPSVSTASTASPSPVVPQVCYF